MSELIVTVRKLDGDSCLKGFADVTFSVLNDELTIKGFRIVESNNNLWIGFPQTSYLKNGTPQYNQMLDYSKKLKRELSNLILQKYAE